MKHEITPEHHRLVSEYEKVRPEHIDVVYYAGFDTAFDGDMNAITAIHYYDSYTGTDGMDLFTQLEDARQTIPEDNDFVRIVVLSLPIDHRIDIELQTNRIQ